MDLAMEVWPARTGGQPLARAIPELPPVVASVREVSAFL
jgi:hypothetical protein